MDRRARGAAVLDMARAVQDLEGSGITDANPVGIMGYSRGGGAAAAEMAGTYAPDLQLKGSAVGAPPADLAATVENAEGGLLGAAVLYGLPGPGPECRHRPRPPSQCRGARHGG
ncbi:lipase family protein [Janibacter limosus]|uniref:lipase family protein n=1 Tax=Janibacter limosus TaxID=53458 RepID=UPI0021531DC1|nr:lipase family protein [Janibacter limosus]WKV16067.1 lipase family protein [Janibacter limosus]